MRALFTLLLFLFVLPSSAFAIDPECVNPVAHDPAIPYPAPDGQIDICTPQLDVDGDTVPETTIMGCLLEVNSLPGVGGMAWRPYAIANSGPGIHIRFDAAVEKWERPARVSCSTSASGEVLGFIATFRDGQLAGSTLLPL